MKTIKTIVFSLLFAITATIAACGAETFRTDINPALQYYQSLITLANDEPTNRQILLSNEWRGQPLNPQFGRLLAAYDTQFIYLRHAAHAEVPCDWGLDLSPGPETLLSHLGRLKPAASIARYRAMWDLQNGRQTDAKDDLLAALCLARNLSRDGTQISALVQIAMESVIIDTIAENYYQFSPDTLRQLADGFDAAPARGTFASCVLAEKNQECGWWLDRIAELKKSNPGNEAAILEGIKKMFQVTEYPDPDGPDLTLWRQTMQAAGGTSDGLINLLHNMEPFYQRLSTVMALPWPEYEVQMQKLNADVQQSGNPSLLLTFPSMAKSRNREFIVQAKLAMVRAAVEYKLHGAAGFNSISDPFGNGPLTFQRFVFGGADRGFKLESAYNPTNQAYVPVALIFVEKDGVPFNVDGANIGRAVATSGVSR